MKKHEQFIRKAVELALQNLNGNNGGPFGALVVKNGKVIATGVNTVTTDHDPTAHAEINAIRKACAVLKTHQLEDCDIYSSCEPCPMCLSAIYWARPRKLYFGATRRDAAMAGFDDAKIYDELEKHHLSRELPSQFIDVPEAKQVLIQWLNNEHKIDY